MQSRIIVIAGTTGAGKSTQAGLLARGLETRGFKTKLTSLAGGHLLAYVMTVVLARQRASKCTIRMLADEKKQVVRRLFKLWLSLDVVSVYAKFLFNIHLPRMFGYQVIIEHYLPTTIAEYFYLAKQVGIPIQAVSPWIELVQRLIHLGGPPTVVFLDSDSSELKDRWRRRGSVDEKPEYLSMQRTMLLSIIKTIPYCELCIIKSSGRRGTVRQIHQNIMDFLEDSSALELHKGKGTGVSSNEAIPHNQH